MRQIKKPESVKLKNMEENSSDNASFPFMEKVVEYPLMMILTVTPDRQTWEKAQKDSELCVNENYEGENSFFLIKYIGDPGKPKRLRRIEFDEKFFPKCFYEE